MLAGQPSIATIFQKMSKVKLSESQPKMCLEMKDNTESDDLPESWKEYELDRMLRLKRVEMSQRGWKATSNQNIESGGSSVILAETSVLHESTINNLEGSGVSCTDKVGSGPDGCEQNVCASLSGKNETFGISRVCGRQFIDMWTVLSFSSTRL